jgi:pSer/pThr/pTyr-binding forkhead associated (FHA) protein
MNKPPSTKSGQSHPTEVGGIPVYVVGKRGEPATLRLIKGPGSPKNYVLGQPETVIGRGEDVQIVVDSAAVSRRHAQLKRTDHGFTCEDLGSSNGIFINGTRQEAAALQNGDTIQIGDALFVFQGQT